MIKFPLYFIILLFLTASAHAQVGIGTTEPTAMLDVNGSMRIRTIIEESNEAIAKDSILVISRNGTVNRVTSKQVVESHIKTAIKGSFSQSSTLTVSLGSGVATLPFNNIQFDINNEFNTTSHVFTATASGIYNIFVQINSSAALGVSSYGVNILKNDEVIAKQSFNNLNVSVLNLINLNTTPPVRSIQTLVQLDAGDTIKFQLNTSLANVSLLATNEESFFTIMQVR